MNEEQKPQYVLCVRNNDYLASLETWKVYQRLPDADAEQYRQMRIIDESGEDYLFPADYFVGIELPTEAKERLLARAAA